jgi:hypothetical protein
MSPSAGQTIEAIKNTDKIVIGKKVLAAGRLEPGPALEYVSKLVYGVAIGIASREELEETFGIAKTFWG